MRTFFCFVALTLAGFAWAGEQDHPLKKAEVGDWVVFESNMGWGLAVTQKKILAAREGNKAVLVGETRGKQSGDLHARWKETVNLDEDLDLVTMLTPGKIKGVRKIAEGKETIAVMGKDCPSEWIAFAFVVEDEDNAAGEAKFWFAPGQTLGFAKAEISVPFNGEAVKIGYLAVETGKGEVVADLADIWDTSAEDDWDESDGGQTNVFRPGKQVDSSLKGAEVGDWVLLGKIVLINGKIENQENQKMILADRRGNKAVLATETWEGSVLQHTGKELVYMDREFDVVWRMFQQDVNSLKKTAEGKETLTLMRKQYPSEWIAFAIDERDGTGELKVWFVPELMHGVAKAEISAQMDGHTMKAEFRTVSMGKGEVVDLGDFWELADP